MDYSNRIISNPEIMLGKPIIKGTRMTVELILRKIIEGMEIDKLLEAYPQLKQEDVLAAISFHFQKIFQLKRVYWLKDDI